jgi:hypothetical protein
MKHLACALTILMVAAFGAVAFADEPTNAATSTQTQAAAKSAYSNKLICKRVAVTGSYVKKTVCKTQEQMDREKAEMDQWAQEVKRNGSWSTVNGDH